MEPPMISSSPAAVKPLVKAPPPSLIGQKPSIATSTFAPSTSSTKTPPPSTFEKVEPPVDQTPEPAPQQYEGNIWPMIWEWPEEAFAEASEGNWKTLTSMLPHFVASEATAHE
eukprot:650458-Amphidinium_carterae.1